VQSIAEAIFKTGYRVTRYLRSQHRKSSVQPTAFYVRAAPRKGVPNNDPLPSPVVWTVESNPQSSNQNDAGLIRRRDAHA
jgi:hypothetical protein